MAMWLWVFWDNFVLYVYWGVRLLDLSRRIPFAWYSRYSMLLSSLHVMKCSASG
jgi:hypothetical protein